MGHTTRNYAKRLRTQNRGVSGEIDVFTLKKARGEGSEKQFVIFTGPIMRTYTGGLKMFNRTVQLDFVKKPRKDEQDTDKEQSDYDRAIIIGAAVSTVFSKITNLVAAYVVLDTTRKIVVNRLSK